MGVPMTGRESDTNKYELGIVRVNNRIISKRFCVAGQNEPVVSEKQLLAIRSISRGKGINCDREVRERIDCDLDQISGRFASAYISELKGREYRSVVRAEGVM